MVFCNFLGNNLVFGLTATWSETVIYWGIGPFWAAGTYRNSGPGPKTEKRNFPELGGLLGAPQKFLSKSAQLSYILHFGRPDPHGREIAKYWFSRPFWPRTALGT